MSLLERFLAYCEDNGIKCTPTQKQGKRGAEYTEVTFTIEDERDLDALAEIAGVDPQPISRHSNVMRVLFH
jgi:hypothetical protein